MHSDLDKDLRHPWCSGQVEDPALNSTKTYHCAGGVPVTELCHVAATCVIVGACVRNVPQLVACWRQKRCAVLTAAAYSPAGYFGPPNTEQNVKQIDLTLPVTFVRTCGLKRLGLILMPGKSKARVRQVSARVAIADAEDLLAFFCT
jgi:hypothetical protein